MVLICSSWHLIGHYVEIFMPTLRVHSTTPPHLVFFSGSVFFNIPDKITCVFQMSQPAKTVAICSIIWRATEIRNNWCLKQQKHFLIEQNMLQVVRVGWTLSETYNLYLLDPPGAAGHNLSFASEPPRELFKQHKDPTLDQLNQNVWGRVQIWIFFKAPQWF